MELLKARSNRIDVERKVFQRFGIDYQIADDVFVIKFMEFFQTHAGEGGDEWAVRTKFDAASNKLVFTQKIERYVEKALQHWLKTSNARYHPTPLQWIEGIRSLSLMSNEISRDQASKKPITISEGGVSKIVVKLSEMAQVSMMTELYLDPAKLQNRVRDIIVAGIPAVIGRKVAA